MSRMHGQLAAGGLRISIAVARFNSLVTNRLVEGALQAWARSGGDPSTVQVVEVPGAFELPLLAGKLAAGGKVDALVALGAVVRGSTPHFDHVCSAASSGLAAVARESGVPIGFGVLTCDTMEQALDRAGGKAGNKGEEAMLTAIEMATLLKSLG